ncbi:TrpR family transcriptional regulator, trp operon repressor [Desulfuromusa kysingii]|uniref:TrpR family transcriptional regulator, trp operon repressor n=1 Tax=Desulfuromusa kysingii TaxID=37625 RepID=A0A1H4AN06_9BACT|nr:Trp family transcriptional regulator [Desulfuromusa kysingii]SEA37201.1 TrpR family transcriptional regulator, trp operon repressor [Desulfuromusa kysingii]
MSANIKHIDYLVNHLLAQNSPEAMEKVLRDLLTANELIDVANRLQIIELLEQGLPQRQIADKLGVGIATVTRGSNALKRSS